MPSLLEERLATVEQSVNRFAGSLNGLIRPLNILAGTTAIQAVSQFSSAIQASIRPLTQAVQAVSAFNSQILQSNIAYNIATQQFDSFGRSVTVFGDRLKATTGEFRKLAEELEIETQTVVGLTTSRLNNVLNQVIQNSAQVIGQFTSAVGETDAAAFKKLTANLAATFSLLQSPEFQDTQETRALLQGNVTDPNAFVAQRLNISKAEFELAKSQGRSIDLLIEKTNAYREASTLASGSLSNVISNFQELGEQIQRSLGEPLLKEVSGTVSQLFTELNQASANVEADQTARTNSALLSIDKSIAQQEKALSAASGEQAVIQINRNLERLAQQRGDVLRQGQSTFDERGLGQLQVFEGNFQVREAQIENLNSQLDESDAQSPVERFREIFAEIGSILADLTGSILSVIGSLVNFANSLGIDAVIVGFGEGLKNITGIVTASFNALADAFNAITSVIPVEIFDALGVSFGQFLSFLIATNLLFALLGSTTNNLISTFANLTSGGANLLNIFTLLTNRGGAASAGLIKFVETLNKTKIGSKIVESVTGLSATPASGALARGGSAAAGGAASGAVAAQATALGVVLLKTAVVVAAFAASFVVTKKATDAIIEWSNRVDESGEEISNFQRVLKNIADSPLILGRRKEEEQILSRIRTNNARQLEQLGRTLENVAKFDGATIEEQSRKFFATLTTDQKEAALTQLQLGNEFANRALDPNQDVAKLVEEATKAGITELTAEVIESARKGDELAIGALESFQENAGKIFREQTGRSISGETVGAFRTQRTSFGEDILANIESGFRRLTDFDEAAIGGLEKQSQAIEKLSEGLEFGLEANLFDIESLEEFKSQLQEVVANEAISSELRLKGINLFNKAVEAQIELVERFSQANLEISKSLVEGGFISQDTQRFIDLQETSIQANAQLQASIDKLSTTEITRNQILSELDSKIAERDIISDDSFTKLAEIDNSGLIAKAEEELADALSQRGDVDNSREVSQALKQAENLKSLAESARKGELQASSQTVEQISQEIEKLKNVEVPFANLNKEIEKLEAQRSKAQQQANVAFADEAERKAKILEDEGSNQIDAVTEINEQLSNLNARQEEISSQRGGAQGDAERRELVEIDAKINQLTTERKKFIDEARNFTTDAVSFDEANKKVDEIEQRLSNLREQQAQGANLEELDLDTATSEQRQLLISVRFDETELNLRREELASLGDSLSEEEAAELTNIERQLTIVAKRKELVLRTQEQINEASAKEAEILEKLSNTDLTPDERTSLQGELRVAQKEQKELNKLLEDPIDKLNDQKRALETNKVLLDQELAVRLASAATASKLLSIEKELGDQTSVRLGLLNALTEAQLKLSEAELSAQADPNQRERGQLTVNIAGLNEQLSQLNQLDAEIARARTKIQAQQQISVFDFLNFEAPEDVNANELIQAFLSADLGFSIDENLRENYREGFSQRSQLLQEFAKNARDEDKAALQSIFSDVELSDDLINAAQGAILAGSSEAIRVRGIQLALEEGSINAEDAISGLENLIPTDQLESLKEAGDSQAILNVLQAEYNKLTGSVDVIESQIELNQQLSDRNGILTTLISKSQDLITNFLELGTQEFNRDLLDLEAALEAENLLRGTVSEEFNQATLSARRAEQAVKEYNQAVNLLGSGDGIEALRAANELAPQDQQLSEQQIQTITESGGAEVAAREILPQGFINASQAIRQAIADNVARAQQELNTLRKTLEEPSIKAQGFLSAVNTIQSAVSQLNNFRELFVNRAFESLGSEADAFQSSRTKALEAQLQQAEASKNAAERDRAKGDARRFNRLQGKNPDAIAAELAAAREEDAIQANQKRSSNERKITKLKELQFRLEEQQAENANKRLIIEQKLQQLALAGQKASLEGEKIQALSIEDDATREATLANLNAQSQVVDKQIAASRLAENIIKEEEELRKATFEDRRREVRGERRSSSGLDNIKAIDTLNKQTSASRDEGSELDKLIEGIKIPDLSEQINKITAGATERQGDLTKLLGDVDYTPILEDTQLMIDNLTGIKGDTSQISEQIRGIIQFQDGTKVITDSGSRDLRANESSTQLINNLRSKDAFPTTVSDKSGVTSPDEIRSRPRNLPGTRVPDINAGVKTKNEQNIAEALSPILEKNDSNIAALQTSIEGLNNNLSALSSEVQNLGRNAQANTTDLTPSFQNGGGAIQNTNQSETNVQNSQTVAQLQQQNTQPQATVDGPVARATSTTVVNPPTGGNNNAGNASGEATEVSQSTLGLGSIVRTLQNMAKNCGAV